MTRLERFKANRAKYPGYETDFSAIDNADQSIKDAFNSGERCIFNFMSDTLGRFARGYVGLSTGHKPVFLLIHDRRCKGGSPLPPDAFVLGPSSPNAPNYYGYQEGT